MIPNHREGRPPPRHSGPRSAMMQIARREHTTWAQAAASVGALLLFTRPREGHATARLHEGERHEHLLYSPRNGSLAPQ